MIRFVDLFAGIGGLRMGFEHALAKFGIETQCVMSSEIDRAASETYAQNFGEQPMGDIKGIDDCPEFDFLLPDSLASPFPMLASRWGLGILAERFFSKLNACLNATGPKDFCWRM
jgi:DNA (cytosine-5)-methyltransferase 1